MTYTYYHIDSDWFYDHTFETLEEVNYTIKYTWENDLDDEDREYFGTFENFLRSLDVYECTEKPISLI